MKFEERKDELKILFADQFVEKIGSENAYRMMVDFKCARVTALEMFLTHDYNGRIKPYIIWDNSNHIIVGYFTLITTCMVVRPSDDDAMKSAKEKDVERIISCVEIEHFALNDVYLKWLKEAGYQNKGLGRYIFREYISDVIALLSSQINFAYLVLYAYNNPKVIAAYRNMGFETLEDDAESLVPLLTDVKAIHYDYADNCIFMFRDVESILEDIDRRDSDV